MQIHSYKQIKNSLSLVWEEWSYHLALYIHFLCNILPLPANFNFLFHILFLCYYNPKIMCFRKIQSFGQKKGKKCYTSSSTSWFKKWSLKTLLITRQYFQRTKLLQLKSIVIINEVQNYKTHRFGVLTILNPTLVSSYLLPPRPKYLPQHPIFLHPHSPCSSLSETDQLSHPYKTSGKIIFPYILIFVIWDIKQEYRRFWTEWSQAFSQFNLP